MFQKIFMTSFAHICQMNLSFAHPYLSSHYGKLAIYWHTNDILTYYQCIKIRGYSFVGVMLPFLIRTINFPYWLSMIIETFLLSFQHPLAAANSSQEMFIAATILQKKPYIISSKFFWAKI